MLSIFKKLFKKKKRKWQWKNPRIFKHPLQSDEEHDHYLSLDYTSTQAFRCLRGSLFEKITTCSCGRKDYEIVEIKDVIPK